MASFAQISAVVNDWVRRNNALFTGVDPRNIIAHLGKVNPELWHALNDAYQHRLAGDDNSTVAEQVIQGIARAGGAISSGGLSEITGIGKAIGDRIGFGGNSPPTLNEWAAQNPDFAQSFFNAPGDLAPPPLTKEVEEKRKFIQDNSDDSLLSQADLEKKLQYLQEVGATLGKTEQDYKPIEDLIAQSKQKAYDNAQIDDYLTKLPGELTQRREEHLAGETDRAIEAYTLDYVPRAMESANARGMLFSGDTSDLLTAGALDTAASLDDIRATLEQEDNQFYFNAAYQNKLRTVLESNVDVRNYIENERNNVLTDQSNRFQSSQNDLNRRLESNLTNRTYDSQLRARQAAAKKQQENAEGANRKALYSQLGTAAGTAAGATLGPGGAIAGGSIGGAAGSTVG